MSITLVAAVLLAAGQAGKQAPMIEIGRRAEITSTVIVKRGSYLRPSQEPYDVLKDGVVTIRGENITVDFNGAVLRGSPETTEPDERKGTGIYVEGKNITIKNARVHGYHIGLQARNTPGLKIIDCDFSYNWKQRLHSTLDKEDLSDWMSYHHNDNDEWITGNPKEGIAAYAGAIYLAGCDNFEVRGTKAVGGQCGLMLSRSNKGKVWNNDFSFLSGLGIGMYRSSDNLIMHNNIDWCVRGFSYGVYNRGQDSAGILMFEQCMRNTIAFNSVTHGGDGFFLWAGQTTMDSGEGGCNDNLLYGNDFSHAPTNGIEATFSRNKFINNLVMECAHGVWGGYSYDTLILGNHFSKNQRAIAIEHGQHNTVAYNRFSGDGDAIALWQNKNQDPNWGYPKHHDTVSHDYTIRENTILNAKNAIWLRDTKDVKVNGNYFWSNAQVFNLAGDTTGFTFEGNRVDGEVSALPVGVAAEKNEWSKTVPQIVEPVWIPMHRAGGAKKDSLIKNPGVQDFSQFEPRPMEGGRTPFLPEGALRGWKYILVDEWGPYDFRRPILWPRGEVAAASSVAVDANGKQTGPNATTTHRFEILGPKGTWKVAKLQGIESISKQSGTVPGVVDITLTAGKAANIKIELEYVGAETADYRGIVTPAGRPVRFSYEKFFAPIAWDVKFYQWNAESDPRTKPEAFAALFKDWPMAMQKTDRLDYASGGSFVKAAPTDHFATVADGTFEITPGHYVLEVTMDDGARVWLDGKPVALKDSEGKIAETWKYQGPTLYTAELFLDKGQHKLHVEHFEIDGYAALKVNLRPKK